MSEPNWPMAEEDAAKKAGIWPTGAIYRLALQRLHEETRLFIEQTKVYANNSYTVTYDDCGYSITAPNQEAGAALEAAQIKLEHCFNQYRVALDESYRVAFLTK